MIERIVVINDLSTPAGGASQLALQSAKAFAARKLPVTYLSGDSAPEGQEGIEFAGLGQKRLLDGRASRVLLSGIYNAAARDLVADWIERNDTPDTVYHLHGWSQILSPAIFSPLKQVKERLVMSAHDFFATCPNGAAFDFGTMQPCHRKPLSLSCLVANCDRRNRAHKMWRSARTLAQYRILPPSEMPAQLLIHAGMAPFMRRAGISEEMLVTLPNPVVAYTTERIRAEENRAALFVGRLETTKGIDLAAQACDAAGVQLIVVGEGALRQQLERLHPRARFVGRLPPHQIERHAREARALLMPSRHMEPFGLTAVEALWSGLPVISSDKALLAPDIERAGAGFCVDPENGDEFVRVLRELFGDDLLARRMSEAAFGRTRHLALTPDEWVDRLLEIYAARLSAADGEPIHGPRETSWTYAINNNRG